MSDSAPEQEGVPGPIPSRVGRPAKDPKLRKIRVAPAHIAKAIAKIIEAARFVSSPPIKATANECDINHQYLKQYYHDWTKGLVDLSKADLPTAPSRKKIVRPVHEPMSNKVQAIEMARGLNICSRLGQILNDQLEDSMAALTEVEMDERPQMIEDLKVEDHLRMKMSLLKLQATIEKGFLASVESKEKIVKKVEDDNADNAKPVKGEVLSTIVDEVERFRAVMREDPILSPSLEPQ